MQTNKTKKKIIIDRKKYLPFHLVSLSNGLSRSASKLYLNSFGVGVIEWRILSILVIDSNVMATDICQTIELDGAAASRSITTLERMKLISLKKDDNDARKRLITLTTKGRKLHDDILELAIQRQELLLEGVTAKQEKELFSTLAVLSKNLKKVQAFDNRLIKESKE